MDPRIDIIVLGATGFTGKHAAKNLALLCKEREYSDIRWGIAGRSREKLSNFLTELEELDVDIKCIPVLECDILKPNSLPEVTKKTKIIINATGPNILLSEPVIEACIKTGTHYVDISAELYHMLKIYRAFNKAAEEANVLVIPACGFDCIPALGGLIYLEKQFKGTLHTVECYNVLDIPKKAYFPGCNKCLLHYGTWESMIHEMQNFKQYQELKKQTFPNSDPLPAELKKKLLWKYPRFFTFGYVSHEGPNEEMRKGLKYSFTLTGKGWSEGKDMKSPLDRTVTVKVFGNDPAYRSTSIALILSAITILKEQKIMPNGGVLTSGAAFFDTKLVERLDKNGMTFTTIENKYG